MYLFTKVFRGFRTTHICAHTGGFKELLCRFLIYLQLEIKYNTMTKVSLFSDSLRDPGNVAVLWTLDGENKVYVNNLGLILKPSPIL